jgi:ribosome recycling factor
MTGSIAHLEKRILNIRAGKASPAMLGSVFVDYYGSAPLSQVSENSFLMREQLRYSLEKTCYK